VLNTPIRSRGGDGGGANYVDGDATRDGALYGTVLGVLWGASAYRVCADGGANRLYDATVAVLRGGGEDDGEEAAAEEDSYYDANHHRDFDFLPDLITGDLDSLRPDVRRYYESRGVPILRVEDQDYHDLDVRIVVVDIGPSFANCYTKKIMFHTPPPLFCSSPIDRSR
jgi:hypothetical protein